MAAYAALVSLFNDLELIPNHLTYSFSFDDKQISSLSQTVEFLINFMDSYDYHGCSKGAADVLESRIATAAYAAHDVIESHVVSQIHAGSARSGKVRAYFMLDLQRAINNMEFVKRKAMQFKAKSGLKAEQPTHSLSSSSSSSSAAAATTLSQPPKDNGMVGFDEVVVRLMDILTGEPSNQRLVVPITGMGGLGKTSLTKTVYERSYVKDHFDVCLWATISQQYSAQNILTQLLYGECKSTNSGDVSKLRIELHKRLWGRRYLIVLDDMWSERAWDEIQMFLPDNCNGSRVVVTTRLLDLAARLSSSPFKLNFLDEDKSWELFCRRAFGREEDCPVELEKIGKKVVKRCRGLPLSIVVMGGHFRRSSRAIEYWEKVANYMNPISSIGEEEQCLEILSLSYQHLPSYLKPCFLYLAIWGEDEYIHASKLLQYWIGEGFIKPKRGLSMEEVGEDYLKDLIDRHLILVDRTNWNGQVEWCKIHDIVRELCLKVCKKEKFLFEVHDTTQATGRRERRLMSGVKQLSAPPPRLVNCCLLRVLLRHIEIKRDVTRLPSAHFQHVNLRSFHLHENMLDFYSIISSISVFWNLQTLYIISSSHEPITLPCEIWEMQQLRILDASAVLLTDPAPAPSEGSEREKCIVLQNLHTLEGVANLRLTDEVCKRMPNLKKLSLTYDRFRDDYCIQNLGCFKKLKLLRIGFYEDHSKWCDVVLSLTFPTSLEELYTNCHLGWEDLTRMISSQLPHLGLLSVTSVRGCEWNLDEEEFCCLKRLEICKCTDLIHLNANSSHFPVLKTLYLSDIPKLSDIPLDIGDIPTLRLIVLICCSASAAVSAVKMVMEQEANGNHDLQLDVYFWSDEFERFQGMMKEECLTTGSLHLYYNGQKIKNF